MVKLVDLGDVRKAKQELCPWCAKHPHRTPLACPRISGVTIYEDSNDLDIVFHPFYPGLEPDGDEPEDAA